MYSNASLGTVSVGQKVALPYLDDISMHALAVASRLGLNGPELEVGRYVRCKGITEGLHTW